MKHFFNIIYKDLFLGRRLFIGIGICAVLFLLAFFQTWLWDLPFIAFWLLIAAVFVDLTLLYRQKRGVFARRDLPERLSNGDENELRIYVESFYPFNTSIGIIDEIPFQFQKRDLWFSILLKARSHKHIDYLLRPTKRGEYVFGQLRIYVKSPLGLVCRRFNFGSELTIPVYPSFLQLRKYELMAISNRLNEIGVKKTKRIGHSMEFDQVKNYVKGDDYRTVNWKATARRGELMVNAFTEEKAQYVYSIIDKSRTMKMPFEGMTLLDYAINSALVLSNVALLKSDKAGLMTIAEKTGSVIPADRKPVQLGKIMEVLYKEKSRFLESNMEALYSSIRTVIKQRSLIIFYTNFESMSALQRQLPFLKRIARFHLLLIVFFENTELKALTEKPVSNVEDIYIKTIAAKFAYEKRLMVRELARHGILSILTPPEKLTVNVVNRYLAIKAQQKI